MERDEENPLVKRKKCECEMKKKEKAIVVVLLGQQTP